MNTEKSLGCSNRCRDIVIFKLLGCRPPASWISLDLCNGPNSHEGRTASLCQISSKSVKPRPRYGYFSIFQDGGRRHLGMEFWNFKFLTAGTVKRVKLHHHAKFRRNRSNRGWDIKIFWFFQDGGCPPYWICNACLGTTHERHLVVFINVQNLVGIDAVVLIICTFLASLAWKRLFTPKNWVFRVKIGGGVGRYWPPMNSFLLLGVYTSVSNLVKIDEEMRPWECPQTDTHARTHRRNSLILCTIG